MNATVWILYMVIAFLTVYPLRRVLCRTGVSGREATLASLVLSTTWIAIALYGGIAWCVSPDARGEVTWRRKNMLRARAAAKRSSQRSWTSSVETRSSA